jgi:hypothetical protein
MGDGEDRCVHDFLPGQCGVCLGEPHPTGNLGTTRRRSDTNGRTKQEMCDRISDDLGIGRHRHAAGGTEPTAFWHDVAAAMGVSAGGSKTTIARRVAESQGVEWPKAADSTDRASGGGDTVTATGLAAVERAVGRFKAD